MPLRPHNSDIKNIIAFRACTRLRRRGVENTSLWLTLLNWDMMESVPAPVDYDVLFEIFDENFPDGIVNDDDNATESMSDIDSNDETSSESSGNSGHSTGSSCSPPFSNFTFNSTTGSKRSKLEEHNQSQAFDIKLASDAECAPSKKRSKAEEKLIRNRESANKSRLKRKHERVQLENTVKELKERVRVLEMENNALLTDNTTLSQQNCFLQDLLKKQKNEASAEISRTSSTHMSAIGGISVLCVVFSVSFFSELIPASWSGFSDSKGDSYWNDNGSGRVLQGIDDEVGYGKNQSNIMFHYALLFGAMFTYYCCHQYNGIMMKERKDILPA